VPLPGGLATGAWTFLGHYTTFIMLVILSSLLALGMYLYFRHKKWLA
jgi:magnesium transporter